MLSSRLSPVLRRQAAGPTCASVDSLPPPHDSGFGEPIHLLPQLLPEKQFASKSLTCVRNNLDIDLAGFVNTLREQRKISIDGGYGKMKGKTFRISNMGDETTETMSHLLGQMDEVMTDFMPS